MKVITGLCCIVLTSSTLAQNKIEMKTSDPEKEIVACKLTSPELQKRKQTVITQLKSKVLEKIETENGFRYRFEGSDTMLDQLNEFIKTERACCPFFEFTLRVNCRERSVWLELSGPERTKDFIQHEIDF